MATETTIDGFEHGVLSSSGQGLYGSVTGSPTIQTSIKYSGERAIQFLKTVTGAACYVIYVISGSPTDLVGSFRIRFTTLPDVNGTRICQPYGPGMSFPFRYMTTNKFRWYIGSATYQESTMDVETDTWYQVDFHAYCGASATVDWRINGVAQTQVSYTITPDTFLGFTLGWYESAIGAMVGDDVVLSYTSGDYPLGGYQIESSSPDGAGTSVPGTDVIEDNSGDDVNDSTNPANVELDEVPMDSSADYIRQVATGSGNYAEVTFENMPSGTPITARAILAYSSSDATANHGKATIEGDSSDSIYDGDMSETSLFYKSKMITKPGGGWTEAKLNALKGRVGHSTNVSSYPYFQSLIIEFAYTPGAPSPVLNHDIVVRLEE